MIMMQITIALKEPSDLTDEMCDEIMDALEAWLKTMPRQDVLERR